MPFFGKVIFSWELSKFFKKSESKIRVWWRFEKYLKSCTIDPLEKLVFEISQVSFFDWIDHRNFINYFEKVKVTG